MDRLVVAVDPAGGGPDDVGIVTARKADSQMYVLRDQSVHGLSPAQWGARVVHAYTDYMADLVVAEANYGGDMVKHVVETAARDLGVTVNIKLVTASRGKAVRAEPIAALYEQGKVHHVGSFAELEDQMATWVQGEKSPDRMDALVWAGTELMVTGRGL